MKKNVNIEEGGFILVSTLMILIVLTLMGVSGITLSTMEIKMTGNRALHQKTFYEADGGTEMGLSILNHSINCISGFSSNTLGGRINLSSVWKDNYGQSIDTVPDGRNIWMTNNFEEGTPIASAQNRDLAYSPIDNPAGPEVTYVRINGRTKLVAGSAIEMTAGYEGRGKSLGADGASLTYQINAQYVGLRNSESTICMEYRVDNQFANSPAGECYY